jgi:uncharacterized radical SAM superfamily Fe-S cluster-containing enzyme
MTIQDILTIIDTLPDDEIAQIKQHIRQREQRHQITPEEMQAIWAQPHIQAQIQEIVSHAKPLVLTPNTMDADGLEVAFKRMREGLSEEELDDIVTAMNEEYIEELDDDTL